MMQPTSAFRLSVGGVDITPIAQDRLEILTLTDNRGLEADQLDITLSDHDGKLDLPKKGVTIALSLGWVGQELIDKGTFIVDSVEHSGAPDKLQIRATSADMHKGLVEKKENSFHGKTFGDIAKHVAESQGLTPVISAALASETLDHVDQTGESDANLLTRLAEMLGAVVTVKAGRLLVFKPGEAVSATGKPLPECVIVRSVGDNHRFTVSDRDNYEQVEATYQDTHTATKGSVIVDAPQTEADFDTPTPGKRVLRHQYANRRNAERAAKAAMHKQKRDVAEFSITLALARPELFPEIPATVQGFKPAIDSTQWIISKATHTLDASSGFTTLLELEMKTA